MILIAKLFVGLVAVLYMGLAIWCSLGDQLNANSAAFDDFDQVEDTVWMAELHEEATHVWSHKQRLVFFLSAMRHFRDELLEKGITVH